MEPRDRFLAALRERTRTHLEQLARESGELFAEHTGLREAGPGIYARLVDRFQLDGAQEVGGVLIDLCSGLLDSGAITLTDREFRGLRLIDEEFGGHLPPVTAASLHELVMSLSAGDTE